MTNRQFYFKIPIYFQAPTQEELPTLQRVEDQPVEVSTGSTDNSNAGNSNNVTCKTRPIGQWQIEHNRLYWNWTIQPQTKSVLTETFL